MTQEEDREILTRWKRLMLEYSERVVFDPNQPDKMVRLPNREIQQAEIEKNEGLPPARS